MSSRKLALASVVLLLLAGCTGMGGAGGSDGSQMSAGSGGDGGQQSAAPEQQRANSGDGASSVQADSVVQQRAIIRTGRMVVEIENFSQSRSAIVSRARQHGGYVGESDQRLHRSGNATWRSGYVVLRVPAEDYEPMQEDVAREGVVVTEETQIQDVSDQLVDLEARLENLRQRRDRLRTFYEQANSTEELLRIEEQLSEVQGEIERLEAQKRSLEQRVAYSTLRVELREPDPGIDQIRTQYHQQSLTAVFLRSVNDVYVFGRASLVTLVAVAPWLGVLAIPALGVRRLLRGRRFPRPWSSEGDDGVPEAETGAEPIAADDEAAAETDETDRGEREE
ncbi:DUF4349 domain-containing protein [Haloarcula marina]|uniref:DUF4349 domain-containing protein n=1 Tax=Haloarcula marina TaxID=2961574 RepID=UPI0020B69A0F|nr:DUF4349 domain-containing protein [Halomicroarcula marina]